VSAFCSATARVVQAPARLGSYLDRGAYRPIQIAAIVTTNEARHYPHAVREIYRARRDARCDGLARLGWPVPRPKGTMFVLAPIPSPTVSWARSSSRSRDRGSARGRAGLRRAHDVSENHDYEAERRLGS
jgi:aspartate/methionine/tyrosine aminotransferase